MASPVLEEDVKLLVQLSMLDHQRQRERESKLESVAVENTTTTSKEISSHKPRELLSADQLAKLRAMNRVSARKSRAKRKARHQEIRERNIFLVAALEEVQANIDKLKEERTRLKKESEMLKKVNLEHLRVKK